MSRPKKAPLSRATQLALGVQLSAGRRLDNFVAGENAEALAAILQLLDGKHGGRIYLQGPTGSGKSHLLQGACAEAAAQGGQVSYIPLAERSGLTVNMLASPAVFDLICLDDVDAIALDGEWQRPVFNMYNEAEGTATRIVFSARQEPGCLSLADLSSRLTAALRVSLSPATDASRAEVLAERARAFGFELDAESVRYILQHHSRDMHHLVQLLEDLDRYSLVVKQRVNLSLLRRFLHQRGARESK